MPKKIAAWAPVFLLFLLLSGFAMTAEAADTTNGLNVPYYWNFEADGIMKLDGNWEFYWDQLVMPGQFSETQLTGYYPVPGYWTKYESLALPSDGQATYRTIVQTDGAQQLLCIQTPELYTRYRLWINGQLITSDGLPEDQPFTYLKPDSYVFYSDSATLEIVLQVKNNTHVYGGIGQSLFLGTPDQIRSHADMVSGIGLFLFFLCLAAALYHLAGYLVRRNEKEYLAFFALCLTAGVRTLFSNDTLIMRIFPAMPFIVGSKIATLTVPICVLSAIWFFYLQFKEDFPKPAVASLTLLHSLYALMVLVAPTPVYSSAFIYYLIIVSFSCMYGLYLCVLIAIRRRKNALYFLAAYFFLMIGAGLDMMNFLQLVQTGYLFSFAIAIAILIYAVMLMKRYISSLTRAEQTSSELKRTLERVTHTETAFLQAQIKPHFIYNALNTIAQCCDTDSEQAGRLILSFSKYLRGTLDFENLAGIISLKKELDLVGAYIELEKARFEDIKIEFDFDEALPDIQIPPLTLQPLVGKCHQTRTPEKGRRRPRDRADPKTDRQRHFQRRRRRDRNDGAAAGKPAATSGGRGRYRAV